MRVAVECVHAVDRPEHVAKDGLSEQVPFGLGRLDDVGPASALHELAAQHPPGGVLVDHGRNGDGGMPLVIRCESALMIGLGPVVELLGQPLPQLGHDRLGVHPWEHHAQRIEHHVGGLQVVTDRVVDPRVLHLDGHLASVVGHRPMHLPNARSSNRTFAPLGKQLIRGRAELIGHHLGRQFRGHRGSIGLQLHQCLAHRLGQPGLQVAGHLSQLHQRALHVAEGLGHRLRRGQLGLGAQFGLSLRRRTNRPRPAQGDGGAGLGPHAGQLCTAGHPGGDHGGCLTPPAPGGDRHGRRGCQAHGPHRQETSLRAR